MQVTALSSHVVPRPLPCRVSQEPSWAKLGQVGPSLAKEACLLPFFSCLCFFAKPTVLGAMTQSDPVRHLSLRFKPVSCDAIIVNAFAMETTTRSTI
ncbi:uncharacterized protein BO95DRAFT_13753 [Aspergillus brunneoviolaceus CBS 621.78]|uniref:Uncharacterized protein n=1 Tax=Aspergillus brunneoviolaceus CBS 621.78 TaxID=1450534 RepID=A0ACD1GJ46_9EURO|nr:hypothetical protein BO95DRAFT_13753 [Aspergillus brunneoviolaceus CBS 621.78]RAH49314.1 hypothetical protein BO95DRAFT_13753 [Aspergillus brunneoviolaceus CBS 621.78]